MHQNTTFEKFIKLKNLYYQKITIWTSFIKKKQEYYKSCNPITADSQIKEVLNELKKEGVVFIRNFLKPKEIETIKQELKEIGGILDQGGKPLKKPNLPNRLGAYSLLEAQKLNSCHPFFYNSKLKAIAQSYISEDLEPYLQRILIQTENTNDSIDFFHLDHFHHRLKFFLLLDDVGMEDAPTEILKGSQRGLWRLKKEKELFQFFNRGKNFQHDDEVSLWTGCFFPPEIKTLELEHGYKREFCTGNAGDLYILDTRMIHRRGQLKEGHSRMVLLDSYVKKNSLVF